MKRVTLLVERSVGIVQEIATLGLPLRRANDLSPAPAVWLGPITVLVLLAASYLVVGRIFEDLTLGGHEWRQGGWLINSLNEPVRRGLFGAFIIRTADGLGLSPLVLVAFLQIGLFAALVGIVSMVLHHLRYDALACLLVLLPGVFVSFWGATSADGMRQEQIAFLAMAALLVGQVQRRVRNSSGMVAVGLMMLAVSAHEVAIHLLPGFLLLYWICLRPGRIEAGVVAALVIATGLAGVTYTVAFSSVEDARVICEPLLERGLVPEICAGAIGHLESGFDGAAPYVYDKIILNLAFLGPIVSLLIIRYGTFRLGSFTTQPRLVRSLWWCTMLPVLPLYLVAIDWGRWISLQMTSFALLMLALAIAGKVRLCRPVGDRAILVFFLFGLAWSPDLITGIRLGGLLKEFPASFLESVAAVD